MDACNFPELLALDLETAESIFASKRMTAGAPRPMDVIFESKSIQDLYEKNLGLGHDSDLELDLAQVNSILSKAAGLAYASPRNFHSSSLSPSKAKLSQANHCKTLSSSNIPPDTDDEVLTSSPTSTRPRNTSGRRRDHRDHRDHARSKSTAASSTKSSTPLDDSPFYRHHRPQQSQSQSTSSRRYVDPYEQPRPTTATGIVSDDRDGLNVRYSPGPIFSISRTRTAPAPSQSSSAVPRYAGAEAGSGSTGDNWDTNSVDSFELPNISLSRRDDREKGSSGVATGRGGPPLSISAPSVNQRIQLKEEQLQQLQQLRQLQQLQQLQQQLKEKQLLQRQLEKQLQLRFQHEQELTLKEVPSQVHTPNKKRKELVDKGPARKELSHKNLFAEKEPLSDKENIRKEAPSYLPSPHTNRNSRDNHDHLDPHDTTHANRNSYGSSYDSYDDSASVSSFGFGPSAPHLSSSGSGTGNTDPGGAGVRGRQQSVVTTATSVTSSGAGCRFSSQSRTLSAMGQYPNMKGAKESQRESLASSMGGSGDRHVEFSLHDDDYDASSISRRGSSTKATTADGSDREEAADLPSSPPAKNMPENDMSSMVSPSSAPSNNKLPPSQNTGNVSQSSWMRFDDDDDEDAETYDDIIKNMSRVDNTMKSPLSPSMDDTAVDVTTNTASFDVPALTESSLPPRPKTSAGHSERSVPTDFRAMNDWAGKAAKRLSQFPVVSSPSPAATTPKTIHVPQRRSSLGHQAALELFGQISQQQQQQKQQQPKQNVVHRLRHFLSFSDASVYSSDLPRGNLSGGLRSMYERPKTSSSSHYQFPASNSSVNSEDKENENDFHYNAANHENIDEPLFFLKRTVYRKPVPGPKPEKAKITVPAPTSEHQSRRGREIFSVSRSHGDMSSLGGNCEAGGDGEQPFVEPLLVSQFDDDSDSDAGRLHHDNDEDIDDAVIEEHLAENDAELFGDFEGAYNYDEGEDKIMTATAMPFSKQHHPRSLRSARSQRSTRSLSAYRLHESIPEHMSQFSGNGATMFENPEETSSHLQSWIEHASRSQQELINQQDQQLLNNGPVAQTRSAFYEDDEPEEEEEEQPVVVQQQEVVPAVVRNEVVPAATAPAAPAQATTTAGTYELQTSLQKAQPVPLIFFSQPGIVGIPLPREVVDTLRVSVSCFPETMLSLSSFSIQTIRSYSRKVRRCSQADANDTYRLLMAPSSPPGLLPPSPTSTMNPMAMVQNVGLHHPPLSPTSPTNMSFDLGMGVSRTMTASSSTSHSSRRFWKLPKKLTGSSNGGNNNGSRPAVPNLNIFTGFRTSTSSNSSSNHSGGYPLSPTGMTPSLPRLSNVSRRGSTRNDNLLSAGGAGEDVHGKANGLCFKRIFPTGSDYLCNALYAHIIAFNYISLLCPPPPQAGEETATAAKENATMAPSVAPAPAPAEPVTAAHTMTTLASSATLFDCGQQQQQRRQTIRVYVGSDVPLPLSEMDDNQTNANPSRLLSMASSRPPSRGTHSGTGASAGSGNNDNDDGRMISRKAALLLGITETLEPDSTAARPNQSPNKSSGVGIGAMSSDAASGRSNSLVRRYNSMRRRHHLRMGHSISESTAAASKMIKKALPGNNKQTTTVEISKPIYEAADVAIIPADGVPSSAAAVTTLAPAVPTAAAAAAAAASDASMRDLHAGLHACISQLVATMKLTTGQLGNTLLNAEVARDIDPLFLRTLCELVRSQEEQF
ncbi:hypothetical protein SEUCBS139899_001493 [Sporothrix eucalyptigena]